MRAWAFTVSSFLLIYGHLGLAQVAQPTMADVASQLANELQPEIETTKHAISVFNYFHLSQKSDLTADQVNQSSDTALKQHIHNAVAQTWQSYSTLTSPVSYIGGDGTKHTSAPGFYAAFDPYETAKFSGEGQDWGLIEVDLPIGTRILKLGTMINGDTENGPFAVIARLSSELKENLNKVGCDETRSAVLFISPSSSACGQVVTNALKLLSADAVLYPFGSGDGDDSGRDLRCAGRFSAALLFIGTTAIDQSTLKSYGAQSDNYPNRRVDLARIQGVLNTMNTTPALPGIPGSETIMKPEIQSRAWKDIVPLSRNASELWIKKNIFACESNDESPEPVSVQSAYRKSSTFPTFSN
jgi:hypothetical protein